MKVYYTSVTCHVGELIMTAQDDGLTGVYFDVNNLHAQIGHDLEENRDQPILFEAVRQLHQYFSNERKNFQIPLVYQGTAFQQAVWKELLAIPYGETRSYSDIAQAIENERAVRAVGQANKANPLMIFIPCHRVIGKNAKLTGYAGNQVSKKQWLLKLEGAL